MSLKNALGRELGIPVRLRAGLPGSFSVLVDGATIYSKKKSEPAVDPAKIVKLIREKASRP